MPPFDHDERKNFWSSLARERAEGVTREVGERLFEAVFQGELDRCFHASLEEARGRNQDLRLRLRLGEVPELAGLPWEYLRDPHLQFLALSVQTRLVRYLELPRPTRALSVRKPLRILVLLANPSDFDPLETEREWLQLESAIAPLRDRIHLVRLAEPTLGALQRALRREPFHILHFVGHGGLSSAAQEGCVVLENDQGRGQRVQAEQLAALLRDHRSLRLVLLNSCSGARSTPQNAFSGTAQTLVHQGLPAVVAMQWEISDAAASTFAAEFYNTLADGFAVDYCLTEARKSVFFSRQSHEWGIPVLHLRAPDGHLFDTTGTTATFSVPTPPRNAGEDAAHHQEVAHALLTGKLVPVLGPGLNLCDRPEGLTWQGSTSDYPPTIEELAGHLAQRFPLGPEDTLDLVRVCQHMAVLQGGTGPLYEEVHALLGARSLNSQSYTPSSAHRFLARLPSLLARSPLLDHDPLRRQLLFVTSNYDGLLERAFADTGQAYHLLVYKAEGEGHGRFFHRFPGGSERLIEIPNEYRELSHDTLPVIFKIHGAADAIGSERGGFAITEDHFIDYLSRAKITNLIPSQILRKIKSSHLLFLGLPPEEWCLRVILNRIWRRHRVGWPSWAVQLEPSREDEATWRQWGVESRRRPVGGYLDGLEGALETLLEAGP